MICQLNNYILYSYDKQFPKLTKTDNIICI